MARTRSFTVHTAPWYSQQHHTPEGFRSPGVSPSKSLLDVAPWLLRRAVQTRTHQQTPFQRADVSLLRTPPERLRVTWLGHASLYVQLPGLAVLTDPMLSERASPLPFAGPARHVPPPIRAHELPSVDLVVLSHNHYDHCDRTTLRQLHQQFIPEFLTPLGLGRVLKDWGIDHITELDWNQYVATDAYRLHCTPARHATGRGLRDRNQTLWAGWYLTTDEARFFFAGDTGYGEHFAQVRERLGSPDVAALPIGAYRPREIMKAVHMNPAEAMQALQDLQAPHMIPIHWGTFDLTDEPLSEPIEKAKDAARRKGMARALHTLDVGESWELRTVPVDAPNR